MRCDFTTWRRTFLLLTEVTGRKDVQNGGRSIWKMTTGFGLFSSLSKVKIYFFLLFTSNLSYFNSFNWLPYKIRLLGFRSALSYARRCSDADLFCVFAHGFSIRKKDCSKSRLPIDFCSLFVIHFGVPDSSVMSFCNMGALNLFSRRMKIEERLLDLFH